MFIFCPLKPQKEKKPQLLQSVFPVQSFIGGATNWFFLFLPLPVGFRHAASRGVTCIEIRFPHSLYPCPLPSTLYATIQFIFNMSQQFFFSFWANFKCCRAVIAVRLKAEKCVGSESDGEAQPENCLLRANCRSQVMLLPVDNAISVMSNLFIPQPSVYFLKKMGKCWQIKPTDKTWFCGKPWDLGAIHMLKEEQRAPPKVFPSGKAQLALALAASYWCRGSPPAPVGSLNLLPTGSV